MKINGHITTVESVVVDVRPQDMIKALKAKYLQTCGMDCDAYINSKGFWETWEDTHGSGLYRTHRKATDDEIAIHNAFVLIEKIV